MEHADEPIEVIPFSAVASIVVNAMTIQNDFNLLAREFDLRPADFYFLELIPLIEMIWADGHNQPGELALLYKFTTEHMAALDRSAGVVFATVDDANDFLDRFAHQRPSSELLKKLREMVAGSTEQRVGNDRQAILHYCMDIAAACTVNYPFGLQERITESEKAFLGRLFAAFSGSMDSKNRCST